MEMYIGLTDYDWYLNLRNSDYRIVNFWRPGTQQFKALREGELFMFKLKKPYYSIVGGGRFAGYIKQPINQAWEEYKYANGVKSQYDYIDRIMTFRSDTTNIHENSTIGCILIENPVFFEERDWINPPADWSANIVSGKTYNMYYGEGNRIFNDFAKRVSLNLKK